MSSLFYSKCTTAMTNACGVVQVDQNTGDAVVSVHYCDPATQPDACMFRCTAQTNCSVTGQGDSSTTELTLEDPSDLGVKVVVPKCGRTDLVAAINRCAKPAVRGVCGW